MSLPYVGLGDSYAAGAGGGARRSECWRAVEGYPVLVARALGLDLAYQACLGATIHNVEGDQAAALGVETTHVSLTIGGNDVGFTPVLIECAKPSWMSDSDPVLDDALAILRTQLPQRLAALLATVQERAPDAKVAVTAYPVLFNGEGCNALTFFSPHEMGRIKEGVDALADTIGAASRDAGVEFVDPRPDFAGHAICDDAEWLNGASLPLEGSFHPNAAGHAAYARLVTTTFGEGAGEVAPERDVRIVEGPARRGDAPTFRLPDLLSRQSRRALAGTGSTRAVSRRWSATPGTRTCVTSIARCVPGCRTETAPSRKSAQRWAAACVSVRRCGCAAGTARRP